MITVIIPYAQGEPIGKPPVGDETLWITDENLGIGEKRIKGAKMARFEWLVMADSDGYYPDDYIPKIKRAILSGKYPKGFFTVREGGILHRSKLESGLVVRKDVFLERVKSFEPDHRRDVWGLFNDLPVVEHIRYYHGLTESEKKHLALAGMFLLLLFGGK